MKGQLSTLSTGFSTGEPGKTPCEQSTYRNCGGNLRDFSTFADKLFSYHNTDKFPVNGL